MHARASLMFWHQNGAGVQAFSKLFSSSFGGHRSVCLSEALCQL